MTYKFKCKKCGKALKDGAKIIVIAGGIMSGNTPVLHTYTYWHFKCRKQVLLAAIKIGI